MVVAELVRVLAVIVLVVATVIILASSLSSLCLLKFSRYKQNFMQPKCVHCCVHKGQPLGLILSQINPLGNPSSLRSILILSSGPYQNRRGLVRLEARRIRFRFSMVPHISLFTTASRPILGPIQTSTN
jgi:hypothetical protein